jgi:hypothetical protein
MNTICLSRTDLEKLQVILSCFPENESISLKSDDTSGIGTILTAEIPVKINDISGIFSVVLTNYKSW